MKTAKYAIGTKFKRRNRKYAKVETVTDILTTKNSAGEVVKIRYATEHEFCEQMVSSSCPGTTIALSDIL